MRRSIGLLLAILMVFSIMPMSVLAETESPTVDTVMPAEDLQAESTAPDGPDVATPTDAEPPPEENPDDGALPETEVPETEPPAPEPEEQPLEVDLIEADLIEETVEPLNISPEFVKVVDSPLVNVVYHYYDVQPGQDVLDFSDYSIASSHSYSTLAMLGNNGLNITANHHVDKVLSSTNALRHRVLLGGTRDVTEYASYSNGVITMPTEFAGHALTIEWYCPSSQVVELPLNVTICVGRNGSFSTSTEKLTIASNAAEISVPISGTEGVVVSQSGVDLPDGSYRVKNGTLTIQASALGGDIRVFAYSTAMMRGFSIMGASSNTVDHQRSGSQIYYGYYTSYYTANGNTAFCLDPTASGLNSGTYPISRYLVRGQDNLLIKCGYYLYGGPGYDSIKYSLFNDPDSMESYGLCHAAASYIYLNDADAFKGLDSSTIQYLVDILNFINVLPMPPEGFEAFLYNVGSSTSQVLMSWTFDPYGDLEIIKVSSNPAMTDNNSCYSLEGAVFDVFNSSNQLVGTITTDRNGYGKLEELPVGSGYYLVETKAPKGYVAGPRVTFAINAGQVSTVQVPNIPQGDPAAILLKKKDAQMMEGQAQGGASLAGAEFTIKYYKGHYTSLSVLSGQTPYRTWVFRTDADGFTMLHPSYLVSGDALFYDSSGKVPTLPLGTVTIQETKAPTGYLINNDVFLRTITSQGNLEMVNTYNAPIVEEDVIRGGVSIEKWDFELNRHADAQGDATLEGAVFNIYNRTGGNVIVSNNTYANNAIVHTMTTDVQGAAATANDLLPYGNYEIIEATAPTGYLSTGAIRQTFSIMQDGINVELKTSATTIKNDVIRGGVEIEKWDIERDTRTLKQGDATLEGSVLEIWNRSINSVVVNGQEYAPGTVVYTMATNADGWAGTSNELLPYGTYEIIEATPPTGYLNTGIIKRTFQIREDGVVVSMLASDEVIKNDVIRGGVLVEKWDNEIDEHRAQGGATLEGAVFEIVNRSVDSVIVLGELYGVDEVVYTFSTGETGTALTPVDLLPYGTYLVREVSPPGGYLATGVLSQAFIIREHGVIVELNTSELAIKNDPIRGDLKGVKISDGDAGRLGGIPFSITSKTTGESHIIVTDKNGMFDTSTSWNPHSQNTNRGETDRDGIWFGELSVLNDELGALLYDTYILEEQPCEANANRKLLVFEVSIYRHMTVVDLGTITNDHIPVPEIFTTAMDKETTINDAFVSETTTILDTVYYSGLTVGKDYTLKGTLMDKATGEPLLVGDQPVKAEATFRATAETGSIPMEFTLNSLALKGKSVVVFETLELDGKEIATHADIEDEGQTVTFHVPKISTSATGPDGEKVFDAQSVVTIIDTVTYEGLISGKTYTIKGTLMDKDTGKALLIDGQTVTSEKQFEAAATSGTVQLEFRVGATTLQGKSLVVFESLQYVGREVAVHADISDENQTVRFKGPSIGTSATGTAGEKELVVGTQTTIVDAVSFVDLIPGKTYTLKGVLMDKATNQPLLIDNMQVSAETTFTPQAADGQVNVVFTLNSLSLVGKEVVVFEWLYLDGVEIAVHTDITDVGQTVKFKGLSIRTSATSIDDKKIIPVAETAQIIDVVTYENLTVGEQYTLKGILMDKGTGKPLLVNGKEVTGLTIFTPQTASGSVKVEFVLNTLDLNGKVIVVFESLEYKGKEIASHTDLTDTNQTVEVRKRSVPKTGDENNLLLWLILLGVGLAGCGAAAWLILRKKRADDETGFSATE